MLRVLVLGMIEVHVDGAPVAPPRGGDALSVLAWLALHPGVHPRDEVAAALWPGKGRQAQLDSLKNALSKVRKTIGTSRFAEVSVSERGRLGLRPERVTTDLADIARLAREGELAAAVTYMRGDVLPGLQGAWVDAIRREHLPLEREVLAELSRRALAAGDPALARVYLRRSETLALELRRSRNSSVCGSGLS